MLGLHREPALRLFLRPFLILCSISSIVMSCLYNFTLSSICIDCGATRICGSGHQKLNQFNVDGFSSLDGFICSWGCFCSCCCFCCCCFYNTLAFPHSLPFAHHRAQNNLSNSSTAPHEAILWPFGAPCLFAPRISPRLPFIRTCVFMRPGFVIQRTPKVDAHLVDIFYKILSSTPPEWLLQIICS